MTQSIAAECIILYDLAGMSEKNYYLEHKDPEGSLYGPEALFFLDGEQIL